MKPCTALLLCAAFGAALPASAADSRPIGPAASAVMKWFGTDRTLGCVTPEGKDVTCGPPNGPGFTVSYGNADGGPGAPDAFVIVTFLTDPTGNAQSTAAAAFHQEGATFRFIRRYPDFRGSGLVPGTHVRFGGGKASMTVVTMKPGDSTCCATGRTQLSLPLR